MSFTEFSYQCLQAHDFWHLLEKDNCQIQVPPSFSLSLFFFSLSPPLSLSHFFLISGVVLCGSSEVAINGEISRLVWTTSKENQVTSMPLASPFRY